MHPQTGKLGRRRTEMGRLEREGFGWKSSMSLKSLCGKASSALQVVSDYSPAVRKQCYGQGEKHYTLTDSKTYY